MKSFKRWGEIRDPVHGYIIVSDLEKQLIDTPAVQRLRRIKQLAGAHLTYPGAEHSRFSHSLGVMHVAGLQANRLLQLEHVSRDEVQLLRAAGLLHDIGHGPFSHVYEEVLSERRGLTHEDLTKWLVKESEVGDILSKHGFSPQEVSDLSVGMLSTDRVFMNHVIASNFDADVMDYLLRDAYFTGVEYGRVDIHRLIDSLDVIESTLAVDMAAYFALEAFVIARYEMFKAVYFHRSVRAGEVMLIEAMSYADEELGITSFKSPEEYLSLDDHVLMSKLLSIEESAGKELRFAKQLAKNFIERRLYKCAYELIIHHRNEFFTSILSRRELREQIKQDIASQASVEPELVVIDVPTVPSVPHYPTKERPQEIPVFRRCRDGSVEKFNLSEVSRLVDALVGYIDVVRVYTVEKHREAVGAAAERVFGQRPVSSRISF